MQPICSKGDEFAILGSPPKSYTEVLSIQKKKLLSQLPQIEEPVEVKKTKQQIQDVVSSEVFDMEIEYEELIAHYDIRLLTGNANRPLAERIAEVVNIPLEPCRVTTFSDGEINIHIEQNVRGADVYIIQPVCPFKIHDNLMELLLLIHTLNLSSAKRITAIMPYYPYGRQDSKTRARTPISASAIAQLVESMGTHRVVTMDLHSGQIQGFFHSIPVDNLFADEEMMKYFRSKKWHESKNNLVFVAPDAGGVERAKRAADRIGARSLVTIVKRLTSAILPESMQVAGDVNGYTCVIIDDMINTAATITTAAKVLKDKGAYKVFAWATHGIFSENALEKINASELEEVCVTDSIPQHENVKKCPKLRVSSIVNLLAEAIKRLHTEKSLSVLFEAQGTS